MRSYWMRILFGALAIFCVGMVGVALVRRTRDKVAEVVTGTGPLSFPLPFAPFQLDGNKLGKVERVVINREAPKKVSSVDLEVKLDDSLVAQGLAGCRLAANVEDDSTKPGDLNVHVNRLNDRTFFFCSRNDSGYVEFGKVHLAPGDVTVPLLIPQSLAERLQNGDWANDEQDADSADVLAERAESIAQHAEEMADSIADVNQQQAEKIRAVHSRLGDSLRAEGKRRADSLTRVLGRMADSLKGR